MAVRLRARRRPGLAAEVDLPHRPDALAAAIVDHDAFTHPVAAHMFDNYDGVLKVDGEVGNKKAYDPRSYLKAAETGMAARVVQACEDLLSAGQSQAG